MDFNPRSPRGERLIHLLPSCVRILFQSTLPARGATICCLVASLSVSISIHAPREGSDLDSIAVNVFSFYISIHAPREGSDSQMIICIPRQSNFNPRSPRGERRLSPHRLFSLPPFQSTLPARGATYIYAGEDLPEGISIHAPREGSDAT